MTYKEVKSETQSWAFTVKKLGSEDLFASDYDFVLRTFNKFGLVTNHCYEKDSMGKIHIHGTIELSKTFYRKKLCLQGFHVYLKEIHDYPGWIDYMMKEYDGKIENDLPNENLKDLFSGDTTIHQ